jgi:hypothetical protein
LIWCLFHQQRSLLSLVLTAKLPTCFPTGDLRVKVEWTLFTAFVCRSGCCAQTISQYIHAVVCAGPRWHRLPDFCISGGLAVLLSQVTADCLHWCAQSQVPCRSTVDPLDIFAWYRVGGPWTGFALVGA